MYNISNPIYIQEFILKDLAAVRSLTFSKDCCLLAFGCSDGRLTVINRCKLSLLYRVGSRILYAEVILIILYPTYICS